MKRKFTLCLYSILILAKVVGFLAVGKFVWFDCAAIIQNGYTAEIGLGMSLIVFYLLGFTLPATIIEFIKVCKSSGSPDDK